MLGPTASTIVIQKVLLDRMWAAIPSVDALDCGDLLADAGIVAAIQQAAI
jgi:hypothetical protein